MKSKLALSVLIAVLATPVIAQTGGGSNAGTGSGGSNDPSSLNKSADGRQGDHDRKSRKQQEGKNPTGAERPYDAGGSSGGSAAGTGPTNSNDPTNVSKPTDGRKGKQRDPENPSR